MTSNLLSRYKAGAYTPIVFAVSLFGSSPLFAHGDAMDTNQDDSELTHAQIDIAPTLEEEQALLLRAEAFKIGHNPAYDLQTRIAGQASQVGRWEPLQDWPVIGVFTSVMQDGRVLVFDSIADTPTESSGIHDFTRSMVWDPATGAINTNWADTGYNLFCSGFSNLPDGRLFIAGGNADSALNGIKETHTFNPATRSWSRGQQMDFARWYPAVTALPNGEMLITGGGHATSEVREIDGTIRQLTTAQQPWWNNRVYPWLQTAPNGKAAFLGPHPQMGFVDAAGTGSWESTILRDTTNRNYGSYAMYDIGKVIVAGGGSQSATHDQRSARVIDLNTNQSTDTGWMNNRRRQHNLTVLADGTVLATGGFASNAGLVDLNNTVFEAELWDPNTGVWTRLADEARARQYHSTALLLPDGRVLSSGGGICGDCQTFGYIQKNGQVFSPPYLFKTDGSNQLADRPQITGGTTQASYNSVFTVGSPQAASISKIALVRNGSVTHSQNMEQRYIPLSFSVSGSQLQINAPQNANIAPPGHYMLFIIDNNGVPSVSRIIEVGTGISVGAPQFDWDNIALAGTASQSSNYNGASLASNAIDGNTDGNYNNGSVSHTQSGAQNWLQIDLGSVQEIKQIDVYNRTDCCASRLSDFHVVVSDVPFTSNNLRHALAQEGVGEHFHQGAASTVERFTINRTGRYVRIQQANSEPLHLAEVQVWAQGDGSNNTMIQPGNTVTGTIAQGEWQYFDVTQTATFDSLSINLTNLNSDIDLYTREGALPLLDTYNCRSWNGGSSDEFCDANASDTVKIGVYGYRAGNYTLSVVGNNGGGGGGVESIAVGGSVSDTIAQGQWLYYEIDNSQGAANTLATLSSLTNDIDLYTNTDSVPALSVYDCRSWVGGTNEESCGITLGSSTAYIGVYGYRAGSFTLNLTGGADVTNLSATGSTSNNVNLQQWHYYRILNSESLSTVNARLSALTNDGDLYMKLGALPSLTDFDCRSYNGNTQEENCSVNPGGAEVYVGVYGYRASSYTLSMNTSLQAFRNGGSKPASKEDLTLSLKSNISLSAVSVGGGSVFWLIGLFASALLLRPRK